MAGCKSSGQVWAFKQRFRSHAYGWHGSRLASERLKEAVSEISKVARTDRILAADGAVALMVRLWPALQDIDTSSGVLGNAVHRTLDKLIPIVIEAPADPKTRGKWLARLYEAVQEDGVQYLTPVEERWGEIAVYPEHINAYADQLLPLLRRVWSEDPPGGYAIGTDICLSSLLEAGRHAELRELLDLHSYRFWGYDHYGAEALARKGPVDAAIAFAERSRDRRLRPYDDHPIDLFCERVLIDAGRTEEAYHGYGLRTAVASTYIAVYRATVRRYSDRDPRQILLDLIEARGNRGKWFAAAKEAGCLDIAADCAAASDAEPATLIRAARDFTESEPRFAATVAGLALRSLLSGRGYEPTPAAAVEAADHLMTAAERLGATAWAREQVEALVTLPVPADQQPIHRAIVGWLRSQPALGSSSLCGS